MKTDRQATTRILRGGIKKEQREKKKGTRHPEKGGGLVIECRKGPSRSRRRERGGCDHHMRPTRTTPPLLGKGQTEERVERLEIMV